MSDDVAPTAERPAAAPPRTPEPATSLLDPRVLQILTTEHSSLLSARSLAYNESFSRGGLFLTFLSMSFVALALVAQAVPIDRDFLVITAVVLVFDLVVGLTTYGRIIGANYEDYRAVYGMARIRHGYGEIAPVVLPYFTTSTHDDLEGVMVSYGSPALRGPGAFIYQLTTSASMIALIVAMVGGVLALVVTLVLGGSTLVAVAAAAAGLVGVFIILVAITVRFYSGVQAALQVVYPTPRTDVVPPPDAPA
jgi:hypothetical protein